MWPRFGIKIGNSTLCVASAKDNKLDVIANKHGDRVSQACLLMDGDEIEIGLTAKQKMSSKAPATICNNFQLFRDDLTEEEILNAKQHVSCSYNQESAKYELQLQGEYPPKELSSYQVCVEFLKGSFELAKQCHISEDRPVAVLSIPHYYPPICWERLARAAEDAGFTVAQVIAEPTAAVLAYELGETVETTKQVLSIKTGGLLTSFTLFEVGNGLYSILKSAGPFYIGGKQFTDALINFIGEEFCKKYGLEPHKSSRSLAKLRTAADNCKQILTTLASTQVYVDSLMDGIDFNIQVSRARFENLIQPVLNEFVSVMTNALETLGVEGKDINEIVLIGATMKIPRLQSVISGYFPEAKLNNSFPPDEVVAIGCARQSLYVDPEAQELSADKKCTCTQNDIYIWHENNTNKQLLLKKGSLLPSQIAINVERSPEDIKNKEKGNEGNTIEEETIFHVDGAQDQVVDIQLTLKSGAMRDTFPINAKIEEQDGRPLIKISCT